MPASITANPNPVLIPHWVIFPSSTIITWNTDGNFPGQVHVAEGGVETKIGPARRAGTLNYDIALGKTYVFRLKRADNDQLLDSVVVKGEEELVAPAPLQDAIRQRGPAAQGIFGLQVIPGIESVRLRFRTRQPAAPEILIIDEARPYGVAIVPGGGVMRTVHDFNFVAHTPGILMPAPLAQNTEHSFRIDVAALPGSMVPGNKFQTGRFRTGMQTARIYFDVLYMRLDGDPAGSGEFTFTLGAGDVDSQQPLGNVESFDNNDISDGDRIPLDNVVTIEHAPTRLWIQAVSWEDDSFPFPWSGIGVVGIAPSFEPPGAWWKEDDDGVLSVVTEHLEIGEVVGTATWPLELNTGTGPVNYSVFCRVVVNGVAGVNYVAAMGSTRPRPARRARTASLAAPGERARLDGGDGQAHWLEWALDGELRHRGPARRKLEMALTTPIGRNPGGPITAVASAGGRVELFTIDADGALLHLGYSSQKGPDRAWRKLGSGFAGSVAAAPDVDGAIALCAVGAAGRAFYRSFDPAAGEADSAAWELIDDGFQTPPSLFAMPGHGIGLLAQRCDGEILHKRRHQGRWWPTERWDTLGRAPEGRFYAGPIDNATVVLGVLAADESVFLLPWPSYPCLPLDGSWQKVGTVDSLLDSKLSLPPRRPQAEPPKAGQPSARPVESSPVVQADLAD